jgi:UDP-2,3-diacylglucosamine hydrolase
MCHNQQIEIKEGAFFISDAHYSHLRPQLLTLIKKIASLELKPTQIIFMGDIFDALFGYAKHTCEVNKEMIELLNDISKNIEIIYLEGNHDFNLKPIFKNIKVYTIKNQPLKCSYNDKTLYIAHGDFISPLGYKIYTSIIRNPKLLYVLNIFDRLFGDVILKNVDKYLNKKDDCKEFTGFKEYILKRGISSYKCDYFIEGHFHQNKTFSFEEFEYINLAAFACNQRYFIVKSSKDKELLEEKTL